ncbi:MAG: N-acetylmuramoyl-L-alanine amidase LytC [Chlamydiia bacterium]|nr:N-acetylmuramoyl-L-alanine amidase LytC [Chlamydiia bacterium]
MAKAKPTAKKGPSQAAVLNQKTIVLDPGHGAFDMGSQHDKCVEKDMNLKTAFIVKKYLALKGYRVILTRSRDEFVPLEKRAQIANNCNCHLFVSLHYNAAKAEQAHGIEVYYYKSTNEERLNKSKKFADKVLKSMIAATNARSRGIKTGNFCVIRETNMPAILVEGGFITNPNESKQLLEEKYIEKIGRSIANGIDQYLRS